MKLTGKLVARGFAALVATSAFAIWSASAGAVQKVTVGQLFAPNATCNGGYTILQTDVSAGPSYIVSKAGVVTSWSFEDGAAVVPGLKLKVGRSAGGSSYTIVGEATAGTQTANTVHTYRTHIAVRAGDVIGMYEGGGSCDEFPTGSSADVAAEASGDLSPGTTSPFFDLAGARFPVSVTVALDCVVPDLTGKTLAAAKDALADASCGLGEVLPEGQKTGKVTSQKPAAGKTLKPGAKVSVRLG